MGRWALLLLLAALLGAAGSAAQPAGAARPPAVELLAPPLAPAAAAAADGGLFAMAVEAAAGPDETGGSGSLTPAPPPSPKLDAAAQAAAPGSPPRSLASPPPPGFSIAAAGTSPSPRSPSPPAELAVAAEAPEALLPPSAAPGPGPGPSPSPTPGPALGAVNGQAVALLAFKNALTSADSLASWTNVTDNPCGPPAWQGISCDASNRVVQQLDLWGLGLQGPISERLGDLLGLTRIELAQNQLAGRVPDLQLPFLQELSLHTNNLAGPLPSLSKLPSLQTANLYNNQLTGPLPAAWAELPDNTTIRVLPNNLCGSVPGEPYPQLCFVAESDSCYPVVNTLGSCFNATCNREASLVGSNVYNVALENGATVWDTLAVSNMSALGAASSWNTAAEGSSSSSSTASGNWSAAPPGKVALPCYLPGNPVGNYLGGDQAHMMMAWGDAQDPSAPASVVSEVPGNTPSCSQQGALWAVDLRYSTQLALVVIEAGANGISNAAIQVSDSPALPGAPAARPGATSTVCAANITVLQPGTPISTTTLGCAATGRYMTITADQPMDLCRVSVYPASADAAWNQPYRATSELGDAVNGTYGEGGNGTVLVKAFPGSPPTFVLDLGANAGVAAVTLGSEQFTVAAVKVSTTSPELSMFEAGARRLRQLGVGGGGGVNCQLAFTFSGADSVYACNGGQGRYVVVSGYPDGELVVRSLAVYLTQPRNRQPPSPSSPTPPPPPPAISESQYVGTLLLGGNISQFSNQDADTKQLLAVYNRAWGQALAASGFTLDPKATSLQSARANVTGLEGPPIFFSATPPPGGNLLTNTSISFLGSSWLTSDDLYDILGTPEVAGSIAQGLAALDYGDVTVWMLPTSQPGHSSSLSAGAVAGISIGIVVVLVAAAGGLLVWRRKRQRQHEGAALRKAQVAEEGLGVAAAAGGSGSPPTSSKPGGPLGSPPVGGLLANSHTLQPVQTQAGKKGSGRPDAALLWGSAQQYGNGLLPSLSARSTAAMSAVSFAASAAPSSHLSRGASANDSQLAGPTSSDLQRLRDDPLLEWILKSQSPPTAEEAASAAAVAATAAATAVAHSQADRHVNKAGNQDSSKGAGDAAAAAVPRDSPASNRTQQQRRGSSANPLMDVRVWQFCFRDLEIQRSIGAGSFGTVYLAKWRETLVAVKILMDTRVDIEDEDDAERALTLSNPVLESLEREASMMAALRHPNVVAFLGVCASPPCVATEYCSRGSLTDVLRGGKGNATKARQLDWARRLNMALDAAKGMHYLHKHVPPIIHRDLKSPNLLVDKHWRVKVSDFNLSKLMEDNAVMSSVAATNPRWLSPEILDGKKASYQSDVYAFGVVLWELLTWELPWGATNPWQVVNIVAEGGRLEFPPREKLPGPDSQTWTELDSYCQLVERCWAQAPADRPLFKEIITQLRDMLERTLAAKASLSGSSITGHQLHSGHVPGGASSTPSAPPTPARSAPGSPALHAFVPPGVPLSPSHRYGRLSHGLSGLSGASSGALAGDDMLPPLGEHSAAAADAAAMDGSSIEEAGELEHRAVVHQRQEEQQQRQQQWQQSSTSIKGNPPG